MFLLTHGDSMGARGGDGIIGAIGPIIRGEKRVRDVASFTDEDATRVEDEMMYELRERGLARTLV